MTRYWVDGPAGCPIAGPFDLWRRGYFNEHGEPPEDTALMYPGLDHATVNALAVTAAQGTAVTDVLAQFPGPPEQLTMAHAYFSEWRKPAPFLPDEMHGVPLRPERSTPEPIEEFWADWLEVQAAERRDALAAAATDPEWVQVDLVLGLGRRRRAHRVLTVLGKAVCITQCSLVISPYRDVRTANGELLAPRSWKPASPQAPRCIRCDEAPAEV